MKIFSFSIFKIGKDVAQYRQAIGLYDKMSKYSICYISILAILFFYYMYTSYNVFIYLFFNIFINADYISHPIYINA